MKAIMIMFDSLNLRYLNPYGGVDVLTPNFERLAKKSVQFQNHYVGSMPCMPARRELHTGRYNFMHRSWGPIEPFDESIFETLRNNGVYTHLVSDHQHYWEDGGATYHTRYSSFEFVRGQEGDPWKAVLDAKPLDSELLSLEDTSAKWVRAKTHDAINRTYRESEEKMAQTETFNKGIEFINQNKDEDNWFVQIETFDPHEPFYAAKKYTDQYVTSEFKGTTDWPPYFYVEESDDIVQSVRQHYAALVAQCDANLGRILDIMDTENLWEDTLLIVNTDHGYLLGEHGWWSKTVMPMYNEIAHIPLFLYSPKSGIQNEKRYSLTQSIDIPATLLDFFDMSTLQEHVQGKTLLPMLVEDHKIRDYALFGDFGKHINITDARYVYMRAPINNENSPLYEYTLMPTRMKSRFSLDDLRGNLTKGGTELIRDEFKFMKGSPCLKIPVQKSTDIIYNFGNKLYDLSHDSQQAAELDNHEQEVRMVNALIDMMKESESPLEQFERLGLPTDSIFNKSMLEFQLKSRKFELNPVILKSTEWDEAAINAMREYIRIVEPDTQVMNKIERELGHAVENGMCTAEVLIPILAQYHFNMDQNQLVYSLKLATRPS